MEKELPEPLDGIEEADLQGEVDAGAEDNAIQIPVVAADEAPPVSKKTTQTSDEDMEALQSCRKQWHRLQADFDNYRKRTRRDRDKQRFEAENELLPLLLPVIDDFETGLVAVRNHETNCSATLGFDLICQHLLTFLDDLSAHPLQVLGTEFDPQWHESIGLEPSDEHPEGTVVKEVRRGYARHGALLRPARVVVSAGPSGKSVETHKE